jgi:hypothetical protein
MSQREIDLLNRAVLGGAFPNRVYKYRDLGDRTFDIIRKSSLWFATAMSFNDPFDCNLSETNSHTRADFEAYIECLEPDLAKRKAMLEIFDSNSARVREICIDARNSAVNSRGILSLSKNNSNILMWSHYASNHTGIVLGYDMLVDPEFFITPHNVSYTDIYDELNFFRDRNETIRKNLSTKSQHWAYEEEIRIIKPESRAWRFKPESLREIVFGCKAEKSNIGRFMSCCRECGFAHVKFYQAEMKHGQFALSLNPIT